MKLSLRKQESKAGYFFTLPAGMLIFALIIYPLGYALFISTQHTNLISEWKYIGFKYYRQILSDTQFQSSIKISFLFAVLVVIGNFIIGLLLASILNKTLRFGNIFKVILMIPWLLPEVVVALIWKWLFNPTYGLINHILQVAGLIHRDVSWFDSGNSAMASVVFVAVWKGYPIVMIMMLAGMKNIPSERYEAASIDGANSWQKFRFITFPGLRPIISVVAILETAWWFKHFTIVWLLTNGGPAGSTRTVSIDIYQRAFANFDFGRAAAESVIILILLLGVSALYSRVLNDQNTK